MHRGKRGMKKHSRQIFEKLANKNTIKPQKGTPLQFGLKA
jgi:hypothetical protein